MRNVDLATLKDKLVGVPGIAGLTQTNIGGRMTFGFNGLMVGVDPSKTDDEIAQAILDATQQAAKTSAAASVAPVPAAPTLNPPPLPQGKPMTTTPAPGSFAASLKAMMDEARAGITQARADGTAKVKEAVGKLNEAKNATATVSANIAKTVENEAAAVMSELGQISNDLTGEAS